MKKSTQLFANIVLTVFLTSFCFSQQTNGNDSLEKDTFIKKWLISDPIAAGIDSTQRDYEKQRVWFNSQSQDIQQIIGSVPAGEIKIKDHTASWFTTNLSDVLSIKIKILSRYN